jgi:serine/threonine protein kinase/tetratricopeptide (TPR) repeat protein
MKTEERRVCPSCGNEFSGGVEFCPVCMLHGALADDVESAESSSEHVTKPKSQRVARRFQHYEVVVGEDGRLVELGRGAMGVTYKAFDVDLRCPVTLKVISEKHLGDESARLRFLREARAAASVRHPNVASVFHLGKSGDNYFYAMEFVEGETLENLVRRTGRLEVKLALDIAAQVAAGLAAVHKKGLVHRDIKPSNIVVNFEDEGAVTAKIIDLGLAKVVNEAGSQTAISVPGGFAGTPEFASPEQFGGVDVDIRSDLYSLGVSLWQMLTGHVLFRGSPAEVMYQHQHGPLPLEQLESVPQPVVSLIEVLLDKDPKGRFQTPADLLKALPTIKGVIDEGRTITYQRLRQMPAGNSYALTRKAPRRRGPEKISIARLPVTGSDIFGREEDIAFLDDSWANQDVNVVTIVAWAGVGKSTLVNHWLRAMAAQHYRSAELVFGWSFYRQGSSGDISSADEFFHAALAWFGDPDPRIGTPWEKGERLANLITRRRTLLVLDGLEPLQYPPGSREGRIRDPSLQALLRELAAFNEGLCVITTRLPVADIADHERASAPRRDLEHLSSDAGARLLGALGVKGSEAELRSASDEFNGHCLALTLLGSYLTDAYNGDVRCRKEVSERLTHDVRQGVHSRKVMESYQSWFGEGPELSLLRMLGLFDRPADERAIETLLKPPAIPGLTESLTDLSPSEWRTITAKLRRARLLAGDDPDNRRDVDTHPLVREYFGEQLRSQRTEAWKECNRRLFHYYRTLAPQLPDSLTEMEPLFLAVICGCHAGFFREALHDVYIPRIQRGNDSFAANVLGARGALLSALVHFFEHGSWESPVKVGIGEQSLTADDQLFVLMQAALHLSVARGMQTREVRICHERAQLLCQSLNRPNLLYVALIGQWRYSLVTGNLTATLRIAERIYSLAQEQKEAAPLIKAHMALAATLYYLGNFESARRNARRGIQIWRSGGVESQVEELDEPAIGCLCHEALSAWHFGEISSCHAAIAEAISVAKELNDIHGLAVALHYSAVIGYRERNLAEVERLASELIALSTRQGFAHFLAIGTAFLGWARSASGSTAQGLSLIDEGIEDLRTSGSALGVLSLLALKAEALHLASRTSEALETINEAEAQFEVSKARWWSAELYRLRGVFLTAMGAEETQIEASFCEAIRIAREQNSISLEKRAEATYAEYRRQGARGLGGGRGFRLPLG